MTRLGRALIVWGLVCAALTGSVVAAHGAAAGVAITTGPGAAVVEQANMRGGALFPARRGQELTQGARRPRAIARGLLAPASCPMVHCTPQLDDNEAATMPTGGASLLWTFKPPASDNPAGGGCSMGVTLTVCLVRQVAGPSGARPPHIYALDPATGQVLWTSGSLLGTSVTSGVPLVDAQDNSYVDDAVHLISFDAAGAVRWEVSNPTGASLTSFNVTADGHLVAEAAWKPVLIVLDPATGKVSGTLRLDDTVNGVPGSFVTSNTVSVSGNRVYTVTQFCPAGVPCQQPAPGQYPLGRLLAIDVVNGVPQMAWHWDFFGPSYASPLTVVDHGSLPVIYFDGSAANATDPRDPMFFGLQDQGSSARLLWKVDFTQQFGIPWWNGYGVTYNAAHDPRGGVWEFTAGDPRLFRFDDQTGSLLQTINVDHIVGGTGYAAGSTMNIVVNGGLPVMVVGVAGAPQNPLPAYVVALNLSTGGGDWTWAGGMGLDGSFPSQFPVAQTASGVVLLAPRWDGTFFGLLLR